MGKHEATIEYTARPNALRVAGAEAVRVKVTVTDSREEKDKVVVGRNIFHQEVFCIVPEQNVPHLIETGISSELANRGFRTDGGDVVVDVELTKFFAEYEAGPIRLIANAELSMTVNVKKADGKSVYSRAMTSTGSQTVITDMYLLTVCAESALNTALQNGIHELVDDPAFIDALRKANQQ